ncbi:hypothetical protein ACWNT8_11920 [Pigmentibacter ruber]|uniref:hypothetical protein n=1 Tax=Pigmentibacter ruber TaxID=2683196 RepID=UPI00131BD016|nr:hypothetical protein [Pigmentibacter ruber]BFD31991.1 hypothetical protein GTC16762_16090 [Pigmentibacter ruber]
MVVENDFEVILEDNVATLKGHLVDSTEFSRFDEIFSKSNEIDFSQLNSISWLGVQRLYDILLKIENPVKLSNIPPHVYRILLLLPNFGRKIGIKSFQIEFFGLDDRILKQDITLEKLSDLGKKQGCFAKIQSGQMISGSLHHLCRPYFQDYLLPKKNYVSKWCIENEEFCTFLYEYVCFTKLVLEICSLAQDSTSILIEESLQNICSKISSLEFSVKNILPNFNEFKSRYLMSLMPHIHEISKSVVSAINLSSGTFESVVQTFEALFMRDTASAQDIYDQFENFMNFTDQLDPIAKSLEDVGVELGTHVLRFGDIGNLHQAFTTFNGNDLAEKVIISLRRKLKYDQYINLTWFDTFQEIKNDFKFIDSELSKCIVALQGFDLVRQVFEHRIIEIKLFRENLNLVKNKQMPWEKLKEKITSQIVDRLVTDQEKYSFSFFFPDSTLSKDKSNINNGSPLFF